MKFTEMLNQFAQFHKLSGSERQALLVEMAKTPEGTTYIEMLGEKEDMSPENWYAYGANIFDTKTDVSDFYKGIHAMSMALAGGISGKNRQMAIRGLSFAFSIPQTAELAKSWVSYLVQINCLSVDELK